MAIYDWPTTRAFVPATAELRVVDNTQRSLESPLSGYVQTLSMPGARWGWGMDFSAQDLAARAALEAYLLRLNGREHRVRLWDLKNPRPRGNIDTAGVTLAASAAQFATTLQLAGCRAANNLLLGGSFQVDSNADGLADGWVLFVGGAGDGSRTHLLSRSPTVPAAHGSASQFVQITAAGNSNDSGISITPRAVLVPGQAYTLSARIRAGVSGKVTLSARAYDAGGGTLADYATATVPATGARELAAVTFTAPAGAATADIVIRGITSVGEYFDVDAVQLERGTTATPYSGFATLAAGDWMSLASDQLVRVVADAMANDAGRMTVEVRHMLRSAVASGSAVTLDRPTALFVRTESGLALPRMAGHAAPGMSAEFVEVFA